MPSALVDDAGLPPSLSLFHLLAPFNWAHGPAAGEDDSFGLNEAPAKLA